MAGTIYEAIQNNITRASDMDGNFLGARITLSDGTYEVTSSFEFKKNGEELPVHGCKGGIYPEVYISGYPMKAYVLALIAVDPLFLDNYGHGLHVNHCVISEESRELSTGLYGAKKKYHTAPNKEVWFNPDYLEIVTNSENNKHAKFVRDFGLFDTYVSAKDLDEIRPLLVSIEDNPWASEYNRRVVESFYESRRPIGFKVLF